MVRILFMAIAVVCILQINLVTDFCDFSVYLRPIFLHYISVGIFVAEIDGLHFLPFNFLLAFRLGFWIILCEPYLNRYLKL